MFMGIEYPPMSKSLWLTRLTGLRMPSVQPVRAPERMLR